MELAMWIFGVILILIILWYVKFEHHTKKIKIVLAIILLLVLYFSFMRVFSSENVDLKSPRGIINAVYVYAGWIGRSVSNLWDVGTETTGKVVQAVKLNDTKIVNDSKK